MIAVREIFNDRKKEINAYFEFLKAYIPKNADDVLYKVLKSNLILMLYNIVESSVSNAIEAIHKNIHSQSTSFNDLKIDFKCLILNQIKNVDTKKIVPNINDIAIDIIKNSFNKDMKRKLFNGNIDRDKINAFGHDYGFDSNTDYFRTKHGEDLKTIKDKRNDLAHGTYSFTEVGNKYTIQDLEDMKEKTINYISDILDNIQLYLANKEYCN